MELYEIFIMALPLLMVGVVSVLFLGLGQSRNDGEGGEGVTEEAVGQVGDVEGCTTPCARL
eukprot:SAG11_NODE_22110_length_412_cov_0.623003_1_plen_60_part_01